MMKHLFLLAAVLGMASSAVAQEPPLPPPSGYEYIAGTKGPFYLKTDSVRTNADATQNTTFALVMGFVEDGSGNKGYVVHQFFAQCGTGRLTRSSSRYFNANQQPVVADDTSASAIITQGTDDAIIHAALCAQWDED